MFSIDLAPNVRLLKIIKMLNCGTLLAYFVKSNCLKFYNIGKQLARKSSEQKMIPRLRSNLLINIWTDLEFFKKYFFLRNKLKQNVPLTQSSRNVSGQNKKKCHYSCFSFGLKNTRMWSSCHSQISIEILSQTGAQPVTGQNNTKFALKQYWIAHIFVFWLNIKLMLNLWHNQNRTEILSQTGAHCVTATTFVSCLSNITELFIYSQLD